ncbi:hypothetical protein N7510_006914 [Penicillium lagena]|uniref:uncharacterized protein n=1 Tax=Penicillium lagena TaxID=94218 RepID=UPI002541AB72|nr:uncharacterized protein N7510_006914 [Penicillium lagena]KAJ5610195.1 hypothetical protein N7510_006914 [Penicillium lagena]
MAKETSAPSQSVSDLNACVSPSGARPVKVTSFREWMVASQIGISLTTLATLLALHNLYPSLRPYTQPFFELSYYVPSKGQYVQGWDDIYFVASGIIAFTAIRAIAIEWILQPLARYAGLKRKASVRFAEQAWLFMYDGFFWSLGMYLWKNSSYWLDYSAIWSEWPQRALPGLNKWYLLVQLSFWIQQIMVIHLEARRKDHYQMLTHHVVTSALLSSAYIYRFYNVSNVVLCLMDIVDFLLPAAKILKYFKFEFACNVAFGILMVAWFITRHIFYPILCWSIYKNVPAKMSYGCYSGSTAEMISADGYPDAFAYMFAPYQDLNNPICMNRTIKWIFLSFLLFLQGLSIVWFSMIVRVAVNVLRTGNAEDSRSDDEEEDEIQVGDEIVSNGVLLKDSVSTTPVLSDGSSGLDHRRSNGATAVRARGRGRVPFDQSDRRALLGRIGCDKPT